MKATLEIFGKARCWSGSFTDDGTHGGHKLDPCPFCAEPEHGELELCNSHTPYYSVRCNSCGGEGPPGGGDQKLSLKTKATCLAEHRLAQRNAVMLWNARYLRPKEQA